MLPGLSFFVCSGGRNLRRRRANLLGAVKKSPPPSGVRRKHIAGPSLKLSPA